jgi:hypothetical protein
VYVPRKPRKHQEGGCRGRNLKRTLSAYNSEATAHVGFVVNKVTLGQVFPPNTSVLSRQYYSSNASYSLSCICRWCYTILATVIAVNHNTTLSLWKKRLISKAVRHVHVTGTVQSVRTWVWCRMPHNCMLSMRSLLFHTFTAYSHLESLPSHLAVYFENHIGRVKNTNRFRLRKEHS